MTDKGSITKLARLINGISMAGPHETIPLESCEHVARAIHTSGWLEQVRAEAWEEGHEAAAMRVPEGVWHDTASPRTPNPYRQEKDR